MFMNDGEYIEAALSEYSWRRASSNPSLSRIISSVFSQMFFPGAYKHVAIP